MLVKAANRIFSVYRNIVTSIGFLPTVISAGFGLCAVAILAVDTDKATTYLLENAPSLVIKDSATARVILSTMVGGLVSLTVFSFTMVMAQLNRAATSYSPRLLPGLISTRSHQVVLGIFLGAITFCLVVLISIEPTDDDSYQQPGVAILLGVAAGMTCLGVFVYFIHTISLAIQINKILQDVSDRTRDRLEKLDAEREERHGSHDVLEDFKSAAELRAPQTGYYQGCNRTGLLEIAVKHDTVLHIVPVRGMFVLEGTVVVHTSKELDDEATDLILDCMRYTGSAVIDDNYVLGFKQTCEIAVRAMSPGTNDPGTALNSIDHLTRLFGLRMKLDDQEEYSDEDGNVRLVETVVTFPELLYMLHASLRLYCKHDVIIVLKLLQMFDYLLQTPTELESHRDTIRRELEILMEDAEASIENKSDLEKVRGFADKLGNGDDFERTKQD